MKLEGTDCRPGKAESRIPLKKNKISVMLYSFTVSSYDNFAPRPAFLKLFLATLIPYRLIFSHAPSSSSV